LGADRDSRVGLSQLDYIIILLYQLNVKIYGKPPPDWLIIYVPMKELAVVLHNIRSVYNTASIFRTADGAGVKKIYLCGTTPAPTDVFGKVRPRFAKVSLGAEKFVEWEKAGSAVRLLKKLKNPPSGGGYKIFAVEQSRKSVPYRQLKIAGRKLKIALVFGNEVRGLPPPVLKLADRILEIPMLGRKESLNVGVAAGIVLYHFVRLERKK